MKKIKAHSSAARSKMAARLSAKSPLIGLHVRDIILGCIMATIGASLAAIYPPLVQHMMPDWVNVGYVAAATGVGYLLKNLFTDANGKFLGVI